MTETETPGRTGAVALPPAIYASQADLPPAVAAALAAPAPPAKSTIVAAGIPFHTLVWGALDAPPLLLLHGITSLAATWWRVGPAIAAAGFRVVAPDLPGHGETSLDGSSPIPRQRGRPGRVRSRSRPQPPRSAARRAQLGRDDGGRDARRGPDPCPSRAHRAAGDSARADLSDAPGPGGARVRRCRRGDGGDRCGPDRRGRTATSLPRPGG